MLQKTEFRCGLIYAPYPVLVCDEHHTLPD